MMSKKQELSTTLEASIHAGFDKKMGKNHRLWHHGIKGEQ